MIRSLAKKIASVFVLYGESSESDSDIYAYACEAIISTIINIAIGLAIALIFGRIVEGIVFISVFALLRKYTGGHHANTHFKCILVFSTLVACAMGLISVVSHLEVIGLVGLGIATIAGVGIFILAPVEDKNKHSGKEFQMSLKRKGRYVAFALWLFCIIDFYILNSQISFSLALSMLSVLGSMAYATAYSRVCKRG